jgi:hypothetical protein
MQQLKREEKNMDLADYDIIKKERQESQIIVDKG